MKKKTVLDVNGNHTHMHTRCQTLASEAYK